MTDSAPDYTLLHTADSPHEAQILRAMLEGEGIPCHVEGSGLADEVAVAHRLMGLKATRIFVPGAALQQAREVLESRQPVDEMELTRQAIAARRETPLAAASRRETASDPEMDEDLERPRPGFLSPRVAAILILAVYFSAELLHYWLVGGFLFARLLTR